MKNILKYSFGKFKEKSMKFKIFSSILLVFYLFIIAITTININVFKKDDYALLTPGEANLVGKVIDVDTIHDPGEVYTLSVFEFRKVSVLQYWLSKSSSTNKLYIDNQSYLSKKEDQIQGLIMKNNSITNSIIVAYTEASKVNPKVSIDYKFAGLIVHTVFEKAKGNIKQMDIITKVNGVEITLENYKDLFASAKTNESIILTVKRDNKDTSVKMEYYTENNEKLIGIGFYEHYEIIETTPKYKVNNTSTGGPSGGLMQTIAIYNSLIASDITLGYRVMGTGTIDIDGKVGEIGGVEQKMITANLYKADIVFVPKANYEDALKQYNKINNPSYPKPIAVETFAEAIDYLNNRSGK